jgi:predicted methyltransferase
MIQNAWFTRRRLLGATAALALTGCGRSGDSPSEAPPVAATVQEGQNRGALAWAVDGAWRAADKPRDAWRHPAETLAFFGLQPGMTVVEMWPGSGWYTRILAPYLRETGGKLYAASFETTEGERSAAAAVVAAFRKSVEERPETYGDVQFVSFGPGSPPLAPPGTVDMVLFMQTVHTWMAAGLAEKAFQDAYTALKPGGVLGVEAHREPVGGPQDPLAANGYVQEAFVKQMAEEVGFRFEASSEINANPNDDHDHPFGVWTLQPERRTAAPGQPEDPNFDRAPYDAVGESDRMTLKFVKPR